MPQCSLILTAQLIKRLDTEGEDGEEGIRRRCGEGGGFAVGGGCS